jgi:hypothetical protein
MHPRTLIDTSSSKIYGPMQHAVAANRLALPPKQDQKSLPGSDPARHHPLTREKNVLLHADPETLIPAMGALDRAMDRFRFVQ